MGGYFYLLNFASLRFFLFFLFSFWFVSFAVPHLLFSLLFSVKPLCLCASVVSLYF